MFLLNLCPLHFIFYLYIITYLFLIMGVIRDVAGRLMEMWIGLAPVQCDIVYVE